MKRIAALFLALIPTMCLAAVPPNWPSITNMPEFGAVPRSVSGTNDSWAIWRCPTTADPGNLCTWVFNWTEVMPWLETVKTTGTFDVTFANAAAANVGAPTAAESAFLHAQAVDLFGATPKVLDGIAYKPRVSGTPEAPTVSYTPIPGTVPVGTPCVLLSGVKAGGFMPIARSAVTLPKFVLTYPFPAYGKCG